MSKISVIVPCYNSAAFIDRTLAALIPEIINDDDAELLLVDNNSTDNTLELLTATAAKYPTRLKVLQATENQGVNVARNYGAKHATGSVLLFTDHDDAVNPGWLAAFRQAFADGAQIAAGPYAELAGNGDLIHEINEPELHLWDIPYGLGSNSGITKTGFAKIGGFEESWRGGGDDADFFWRAHFAGMPLTFVPSARITHHMRDDDRATFQQFRGYGRAAVRLYAKFREFGMPRSSTIGAVGAWPLAIVELLASLVSPKADRRRALSRLGVRTGRLTESICQRVIYL